MNQPRSSVALVGNDVVDLGDSDNHTSFARPGYVERVCTPSERRAIEAAEEPERLFCALFAAKEASYKLLVKIGEEPGLAHRRIEVAGDLASSRFDDRELGLSVQHGEGWVHALATLGTSSPRFEVESLPPHARASAAGRDLLCRMAAAALHVTGESLSIERRPSASSYDGYEPPRLCDGGVPTGLDVSLSHDGRFVAGALAARD